MDRRDGLDGKLGFFVLLASVLYTPQVFVTTPLWIQRHGGGAAILPYVIGVVVVGIPLVFLELSMGQFMQKSGTRLWAVAPLFKGLAISSLLSSLVRSSVNANMAAWAGSYIYLALTNQIPSCNTTCLDATLNLRADDKSMDWSGGVTVTVQSTPEWRSHGTNSSSHTSGGITHPNSFQTNLDIRNHQAFPLEHRMSSNSSQSIEGTSRVLSWNLTSCQMDFLHVWRNDILNISPSIASPGQPSLHVFIGNSVLVFVSILVAVWGVGVMRRIVALLLPVTIVIPAAILTQACVEDAGGVWARLSDAWAVDFQLLTSADTWFTCCHQVLLMHGLTIGVLPSLSSYLKWNNNALRDAVLACVLTGLINMLGCFLVFSLAVSGTKTTTDSPEAFLFTTLPLSISLLLPHPHVWIVLFFLLFIVVVLTSNAIYWEVAILAVTDASKSLPKWRPLIVIGAASFVFLLTIPMSLQNGVYIVRLLEFVVFGPFLIGVVSLVQCLVMAFVYGGHKFYDNLETMTGYRPHWWIRFSWAWLCPVLILASQCYHGQRVYSNAIILGIADPYPDLSNMLMLVITCLLLLPVPLAAVWVLCSGPVGCLKKLRWSIRPRLHPFQIPIRWRLDRNWHKFSPLR